MANKFFRLGILVIALIFGMTVIGCDNGTTGNQNDNGSNTGDNNSGGDNGGDGNNDPKVITITGLTGKSGEVSISIQTVNTDNDTVAATGTGTIAADDSVVLALMDKDNVQWTGSGSYYLSLHFMPDSNDPSKNEYWMYTNGKELTDFGGSGSSDANALPKYNINSSASIALTQFRKLVPHEA